MVMFLPLSVQHNNSGFDVFFAVVGLVGRLMFNGTFSTARLYRAMSALEINPVIYLL